MSSSERTPLLPQHVQHTANQAASQAQEIAFSLSRALGALKAGKLPSQQQLDKLIDHALESDVLAEGSRGRTGRLSEDGARVVRAFKEVLAAIKAAGDEKNGDNKIQSIIYQVTEVEPPTTGGHVLEPSSSTLVNQKELNRDSTAAVASLQKILQLFVTSPQFRLIINQGVSLGASIIADASAEVADKASQLEKKARETGSDDKPINLEDAKRKGKKVSKGLTSGRIQGEAREDLMDKFEDLGKYFEDKISGEDEAKDKLFEKLKAVIKDVQSNGDYQSSVDTILSLIKKYYAKAGDLADKASEQVKEDADQTPIQEALSESKELVETFAGHQSLDPVLEAAKKLKADIEANNELEAYFSDVGKFVEACLKVEGYVTTQRAYRRSSALWDRGQNLLKIDDRYKKDLDELLRNLTSFGSALANDPTMSDLALKIENFSDELIHAGKTGLNALRAESAGLWRDFIDVVLPRAVALIKEIPAPRTEFKSEAVDFVIDDISFKSASFIPSTIRLVNKQDLVLSQGYAAFAADFDASIRLRVEGLKFAAEDIAYWFDKKSGWLSFEDEGLLDLAFNRKGISFDVVLDNASEEDRESFFVVRNVDVDISDLEYHIKSNKSWMLYLCKPFVSALIKANLKSTLESQITSYLRDADLQLFGLQQRAIAATNAKPTPLNYLKAIFSPAVFSSTSTSRVTQKGIVKHGRRGEYLLQIGVDEMMFPGKAVSPAQRKRRAALDNAQAAANGGTREGRQVKIDAEREVSKLGLTVKDQQQRESLRDGWKSDAFNL